MWKSTVSISHYLATPRFKIIYHDEYIYEDISPDFRVTSNAISRDICLHLPCPLSYHRNVNQQVTVVCGAENVAIYIIICQKLSGERREIQKLRVSRNTTKFTCKHLSVTFLLTIKNSQSL